MPMMPIDPANAVKNVRPFLVIRLRADRPMAVAMESGFFFCFPALACTGADGAV